MDAKRDEKFGRAAAAAKVGGHRGNCAATFGLAMGAAAAIFVAPIASGALQYQVEKLDSLGNGKFFRWARAVNDAGDVAGDASRDQGQGFPAARWDVHSSTPTAMQLLAGGFDGLGFGINNSGDVVGQAIRADRGFSAGLRPVRWNGTVATELGMLTTLVSADGNARAINDTGVAVGYVSAGTNSATHTNRAVRWAPSSTVPIELGNLGLSHAGLTNTYAYSINQAGDIVGTAEKYQNGILKSIAAVRWAAGSNAALELPTLATGGTFEPSSINDSGAIAGKVTIVTGTNSTSHAIVWPANGGAPVELPNLGLDSTGHYGSVAVAINNAGDVVGTAVRYVEGVRIGGGPALWLAGSAEPILLQDLFPPETGWQFVTVSDINNNGVIVGDGYFDPDGSGPLAAETESFRLIPVVPEPQAILWFGLSIGLCRHRRARITRHD